MIAPTSVLLDALKEASCTLALHLTRFEDSRPVQTHAIPLSSDAGTTSVDFAHAHWLVTWSLADDADAATVEISSVVESGTSGDVALSLVARFSQWSPEVYVLCPGAAYNGNRFRVINSAQTMSTSARISGHPAHDALITNVPRLSCEPGPSRMQFLAGDMALPCVGLHLPAVNLGLLLTTCQRMKDRDTSLAVRESDDRSSAEVVIRTPGIREETCWKSGSLHPSPDRGVSRAPGDALTLTCRLAIFDSPTLQTLFDRFITHRNAVGIPKRHHEIPFSAAFGMIEHKYNRDSWVEREGYFSVGMRANQWQNWQTGWTGGMNAVYPLMAEGSPETQRRVLRTFDFLVNGGISPTGFFYDVYHNGEWRGNETDPKKSPQIGLLRRNSDALFFIIKEFTALRRRDRSIPAPWLDAARGCADAFVRLWKTHGQFGQWINLHTGDLPVLNSASNGIAPAALALSSGFFGVKEYLDVACAAAANFHRDYVQRGILNGGPGDAAQCPDSESSFGLLESFVTLYEVTGDPALIDKACDTANQCATWVVPYDFVFPGSSTFHRLGMLTTGTVIANVQNKHSAPGICSLSGSSLFRLFRATGNRVYLNLIRDIAHAIPQFISRDDRPIPDIRACATIPSMPSGWINERVNMSDWEEVGSPGGDICRGEIFAGSCWSEVSCLLTYAEIPGVYVQTDTGLVCALDHVDAAIVDGDSDEIALELHNPTRFDASVKVLAERSTDCWEPLEAMALVRCLRVAVPAGSRTVVRLTRKG